jgi:thiamine biosynthesis lipoprotein
MKTYRFRPCGALPDQFATGRFLLTATLAVALLVACQRGQEQSAQLYVFGTLVEVKTWGAPEAQAEGAFAELDQMFQQMHRDWHAWEPGRLTGINQAFAAGRPAQADAGIVEMIRRSQLIEPLTGGRFNPAIGGLIDLWGFHTSDFPVVGPPPAAADIDRIVSHRPSTLDIHIDGLTLRSDNPYVQLDFGGLAKGYAVDLAIRRLRALGIDSAIVNAGGDLRAMGRHGDRPWRVAIRKPGGGVIGAVEVHGDEALFTSGNYERFRQDQLQRYPHILDPHSGWPVEGVASATVITNEGIVADAAATALVVAGLDDWPEVASAMGLDQVLMVDESGKVYLTPAMEQRVYFPAEVAREIVTLQASPAAPAAARPVPGR